MPQFPFTTKDGRTGLVRVATPGDAKAASAITRAVMNERPRTLMVFPEEFWSVRQWRRFRLGWESRGAWLVAELGGMLVGMVTIHRGDRASIRHTAEFGITVAADARDIGIGRALIEAMERWAREQGIIKVCLRVFVNNERAKSLYEKLGYEIEGVERRQVRFPDGEEIDTMLMAKFLA
ncbi:MAG: N-acetyltransferase family protein [Actinomycetota bacterium]|nr:GNAT family N-acetyltransferase [Actinomycetota bacterium]